MTKKDDPEFRNIVRAALDATRTRDLLRTSSAVVLERVARGAGATNWYYCRSETDLNALEGRLLPGSAVSFYFDGRIRASTNSPQRRADIQRAIREDRGGGSPIGVLADDGITINMEIVCTDEELDEILSTLSPSAQIFYGRFPGRDNDGLNAVTIIIPDRDGVVRSHPH